MRNISSRQIESVALLFRALGEENRIRIIKAINHGEKSVNELSELTGLSQPNASRHLAALVGVKVLKKRKKGVQVLYSLKNGWTFEIITLALNHIASNGTNGA